MRFDRNHLHKKTLATIAGISAERGIEIIRTHDFSINVDKFKQYLIGLRETNRSIKLAVFMDRLNVHRSAKIRELAHQLGIKLVFNASYSPDLNPIERVFALTKLK